MSKSFGALAKVKFIERALQRLQTVRENPFLSGGIIYMVGVATRNGIAFLSIPIFAYLLTPEQLGRTAVFTSWHSIFLIVLNLNLKSALYNAHTDFGEEQFDGFVSAIITLGLISSAIISLLLILLPTSLANIIFGLDRSWILLGLLSATLTLPAQVAADAWRVRKQALLYSLYDILITAFAIILSVLLILIIGYMQRSDAALGRILGIVVAHIIIGLYFLVRRLAIGKTFFNPAYWRYALRISVPLVAYGLSFILLSRSDQMLIQLLVGDYETGLYSIAYRLGELSLLVFFATDSLWTVWLFARLKAGNHAIIRKRAHQYMLFFAAMTLILMFVAPTLLRLITPQSYWDAARLVPIVMMSGFQYMLYSICGSIELYYKKTGFIALGAGVVVVVNILSNIILLPIYGYHVAAATTVGAYFLLFLIHTWYVYTRLKHGDLFNWIFATLLSVVFMVIAAVLYTFNFL